jgi:hypothetical protein
MLAFLFLMLNANISNRISQMILSHIKIKPSRQKVASTLIALSLGVLLFLLYIGLALLIVYAGSKYDERLGLLFIPLTSAEQGIIKALDETTLIYLGTRLRFLERVIYWLMGWHIFRDYPILGVGLGNTGFLVNSHISPEGWATTEFRNLIYRFGFMVNTKSYWIRILAETGLVGFSLFVTWLTGLWRSSRYLLNNLEKTIVVVGLMGQLALIAFVIEGFSLDSFALPYIWIIAGLVSSTRKYAAQLD